MLRNLSLFLWAKSFSKLESDVLLPDDEQDEEERFITFYPENLKSDLLS